MNEEMIRRSDAIKEVKKYRGLDRLTMAMLADDIRAIPTIEPKRGEWLEKIETNSDRTEVFYSIICSCCGFHTSYDETPYCPNCGARMKGKDNE